MGCGASTGANAETVHVPRRANADEKGLTSTISELRDELDPSRAKMMVVEPKATSDAAEVELQLKSERTKCTVCQEEIKLLKSQSTRAVKTEEQDKVRVAGLGDATQAISSELNELAMEGAKCDPLEEENTHPRALTKTTASHEATEARKLSSNTAITGVVHIRDKTCRTTSEALITSQATLLLRVVSEAMEAMEQIRTAFVSANVADLNLPDVIQPRDSRLDPGFAKTASAICSHAQRPVHTCSTADVDSCDDDPSEDDGDDDMVASFDEDQDEDEVLQTFFHTITANTADHPLLTLANLNANIHLLQNHPPTHPSPPPENITDDSTAFYTTLHRHLASELLTDPAGGTLDFAGLKASVGRFPERARAAHTRTHRLHFTRSLHLDRALARRLPPGTLADGLCGVRTMSPAALSAAAAAFARDALRLLRRRAAALRPHTAAQHPAGAAGMAGAPAGGSAGAGSASSGGGGGGAIDGGGGGGDGGAKYAGSHAGSREGSVVGHGRNDTGGTGGMVGVVVSAAAEANSKYMETAGATTACFATLEDFFAGPERRIGYPNPNLLQGILTEHTTRPNGGRMFVAPNYSVASKPAWEYRFVVDPSCLDHPPDLRARMDACGGLFPGEVGDALCYLWVHCTVKAPPGTHQDSLAAAAAAAAALEQSADRLLSVVEDKSMWTEEHLTRGVKLIVGDGGGSEGVQSAAGNCVEIRVALPLTAKEFTLERRAGLVRSLVALAGGQVEVEVGDVAEERYVYSEFVDEAALRSILSKMNDDELVACLGKGGLNLEEPFDDTKSECNTGHWREELVHKALQAFQEESKRLKGQGVRRRQGRRRALRIEEYMHLERVRRKVEQAKLIDAEVIALRLYTGPMYVLYNAVLRGWPKPAVDGLHGNHYETTISVLSSGITKLSRTTRVPPSRLLYRGLGGMLLPEQFWRDTEQGFLGGVELGLMSTTADKNVAIQYSGHRQKRAIIFEISAGRVDVGASIGFLSQYPGEKEFLMQPLSCLEVMGRPRLELTPVGEVIVFPLRVNVNLKGLIVEELVERRKRLHLAMSNNLQEELSQQIKSELECEPFSSSYPESVKSSVGDPDVIENKVKDEYKTIIRSHESLPAADFNDETAFKRLIIEIIDAKVHAVEKIRVYLRFRQALLRGQESDSILQNVHLAPLKMFADPYVEHALRTGINDFPWHDIVTKKPAIDLGGWSPVGREEWMLNTVRQIVSQVYADGDNVKLVTIKGHALPFPQGILSAEVVLDGHNVGEILNELSFLLSINQTLSSLSFRNNNLRASDWATALDNLKCCSQLTKLCGIALPQALFQGGLETVSFSGKQLDNDSVAALCGLLPRSASSLTQLDFGVNIIGDAGAISIAETLPTLSKLNTLILRENAIGDDGLRALTASLTCLRELQLVNLDTNPSSPAAYTALAATLGEGISVSCVALAEQDAFVRKYFRKFASAAALEAALLPDINLNGFRIGPHGARALSGFLRRPGAAPKIRTLNVYANDIGDEGAKAIAAALPHLTELRELSMRHNRITAAGANAVAAALPYLPKLTYLGLNGNSLEEDVKTLIREQCRLHCPAITELLLDKERR